MANSLSIVEKQANRAPIRRDDYALGTSGWIKFSFRAFRSDVCQRIANEPVGSTSQTAGKKAAKHKSELTENEKARSRDRYDEEWKLSRMRIRENSRGHTGRVRRNRRLRGGKFHEKARKKHT